MTRLPVPQFHLYGESESFADPGFVHIETIESRSRRNNWEIAPHWHDRLDQLLVLLSGRVTSRIDTVVVDRQGPLSIYVPAGSVHGFVFGQDVDGDVLTFSSTLGRSVLPAHYPASLLPDSALVLPMLPTHMASISPMLEALRSECSGHESGRIAAASWLVALLLLQVQRARSDAENATGAQNDRGLERERNWRTLVDTHFAHQRPVSFYAEQMGITEKTLGRMCAVRFGCSPQQYLHRRLLLEAQRMLLYSSATIADIADELGFVDPSYFTRFYRRMTGTLPSAHRDMRLQA